MERIDFAIDRGGTFTDVVARIGDRTIVKKVLSRSQGYEESCSHAILSILQTLGLAEEAIGSIRMGTTIATNALLERQGEPVALVVTEGFGDLLRIGDQSRPDIFALHIQKTDPLYVEVLEAKERLIVTQEGVKIEKPLDEEDLRSKLRRLDVRHLAVCLAHSWADATHERRIQKIAEEMGFSVVCSVDVTPLPHYLHRAQTSLVDAYLTPKLRSYLERFKRPFSGDVVSKTRLMQSDGTLCRMEDFRGSRALLSGPAGGVTALGAFYDGIPLIGFDMGGTSTDVCRYDGDVTLRSESETAGVAVRVPQVDLHTVASGGGSRLFYRDGLLFVGPESSGADPGPLCYGKGGFLSVSDANLVTGRLAVDRMPRIFGPHGDAPVDREAARAGLASIAQRMGRSIEAVAEDFLAVADETMATAIKEVTTKKGFDPGDHILCAFGGAGGQHAVGVAKRLGIAKVIVPPFSGLLSAFGMTRAKESRSKEAPVQKELSTFDEGAFAPLYEGLRPQVSDDAVWRRWATLRYEGTSHGIEVAFEDRDSARQAFEARHQRELGYLMKERPIVVASIRLVAEWGGARWPLPQRQTQIGDPRPSGRQPIFYDNEWYEGAIYDVAALGSDASIEGPALLVQEGSTIFLPPAAVATIDRHGGIHIDVPPCDEATRSEDAQVTLLHHRFHFAASRMGDMLRKSAVSTNIKERLDFSCAIFDPQGALIANAPHIPVHLGSMSSVVQAIIEKFDVFEDGMQFVTNAPYEGGSHLPDITVVAPCVADGEVRFWVASRGHHADIGGAVPGSMPPFSHTIEEEGALIEAFALVDDGRFEEVRIRELLERAGARAVEENLSDLRAQIAANVEGIRQVRALIAQSGADRVADYFDRIVAVSEGAVRDFFRAMGPGEAAGSDYLDGGEEIALKITIDREGGAIFDFRESSLQSFGNQNTPYAIVRSAVLYAIRVMVGRDLPLNDGLLAPVTIRTRPGSLLAPSPRAAVAAGNVTTSQRIVDLILGLLGQAAASQGCMNNILFGNESFGYYETIAGGAGATPRAPGASGVHTHMTNTRITDVEILERRYPIVIERFSLRPDSGGDGLMRGGDGVVRIYRFLEEMDVNIISERRVFAPFGLHGGGAGAKGRNVLIRGEELFRLPSKVGVRVGAGDRIVIETPGGGGWGKENR